MIHQPAHPVTPWLVDKKTAAIMLALSERMIDKFVEAGELPKVRFGKARGVRFRVADLERIIEDRIDRVGAEDGRVRDRGGRFRKEA